MLNETKGSWFQMRSKLRMVLAVFAAVFALGAVAASSASAAPEWYVKKAGVYEKIATGNFVNAAMPIASWEIVAHPVSELIGPLGISCTGEGSATLKAAGEGNITPQFSSCSPTKNCTKLIAGKVSWFPATWKTELYTEAGKIRDRIVAGSEGPEVWWNCEDKFHIERIVHCSMATSGLMKNSALGLVEDEFEKLSTPKCATGSGKELTLKGEVTGVSKVQPAKNSGVEAIKVE